VASEWQEELMPVAGIKVQVLHGGRGAPLLVLHGAGGPPGWLRFHAALAEHFHVYAPAHPGFGASDRPDWIERVGDLAYFYRWFLEELRLAPLSVVGFSMGGWLAAEMAAMYPAHFRRLVLVGAAGLKPESGEIADIFLMTPEEVRQAAFYDPQQAPEYAQMYGSEPTLEQRQQAAWDREMAALLTWKPYMHNPKLPTLLAQVRVPTLIVWGRQDALVPLNCGTRYQAAIPDARLAVLEHCGHSPQVEKPQEFLATVLPFLTAA
jgi:pimeloyl-ACP methyl ester carboxylesterase